MVLLRTRWANWQYCFPPIAIKKTIHLAKAKIATTFAANMETDERTDGRTDTERYADDNNCLSARKADECSKNNISYKTWMKINKNYIQST